MILTIRAIGRPAPQGSKDLGAAGQVIESSPYLPAWRQCVRIATFRAYAAAMIDPLNLPVFAAGRPVTIERITFYLRRGEQGGAADAEYPVGDPDVDKLLRATLDALGGRTEKAKTARLFADDSQVIKIKDLGKEWAPTPEAAGALIIVSDGRD